MGQNLVEPIVWRAIQFRIADCEFEIGKRSPQSATRNPQSDDIRQGLLINELVTNSLKHAFPDGRPGEVHVRLADGRLGICLLTGARQRVGL